MKASTSPTKNRKNAVSLPGSIKLTFDQDSYAAYICTICFILSRQIIDIYDRIFTPCSLSTSTSQPIGSYGGERYEKRDLQMRVRKRFAELQSIDEKQGRVPWHVVDASQSIEDVTKEISSIVTDTVERVQGQSVPLSRMWGEGEYELPAPKATEENGEMN